MINFRAWTTAPLVIEAPLNDFQLMRKLLTYPHEAISADTSKKLGLHTWYNSHELVALALFDSRIAVESKKLMTMAMEKPAPDHSSKHPVVPSSVFHEINGLEQFFTANFKKLFDLLKKPQTFLQKNHPSGMKIMDSKT